MGKIFDIQRFCTSDGPGIRTTVFFKGCPLKCAWCHNPESQLTRNQLMFDSEQCVNCMHCINLCENNCHKIVDGIHIFARDNCIGCGKCLSTFCTALEISGYEISAEEVLSEVMKDKAFYDNSGGGITLSGGEPLFQFEFCMELLKEAKSKGLHICMETGGFAKTEQIVETAKYTDVYLFDYKCTDLKKHSEFIGTGNKLIIENLYALDKLNKAIILRLPIIPGVNDNEEHLDGVIRVAASLDNLIGIEVEPYHSFGVNKYKKLGKDYLLNNTSPPDELSVDKIIKYLKNKININIKKA